MPFRSVFRKIDLTATVRLVWGRHGGEVGDQWVSSPYINPGVDVRPVRGMAWLQIRGRGEVIS